MRIIERLLVWFLALLVVACAAIMFGPAVKRQWDSYRATMQARAQAEAAARKERKAKWAALEREAARTAAERSAELSAAAEADAQQAWERQQAAEAEAVANALDPDTLVAAYDENEVRADHRYKATQVTVKGEVVNIAKDFFDKPYLSLRTPGSNRFRGVQCSFTDADSDTLASLNKGDTVTVIGTCGGLMVNVQLKDCRVVRVGRIPIQAGAALPGRN